MKFGTKIEDLKFAWRLCRRARKRGKYRPYGSYELNSDSDTGYLYRHGGFVYIVINGSDNILEWFKNIFWILWGKDRVSAGFLKVSVEFAEMASTLLYPGETVVGIGHSRGGAAVQKMCLELHRKGFEINSVVSFGAPKMGWFVFCRSMKKADIFHVRVTAPADPVPGIPILRGKHYETIRVEFDAKRDVFDINRTSKFLKGVVEHLSYGSILDSGREKWIS